jgi:hypothetical protein
VLFISEDDGDRQAIAAVDLTSGAKVIIVK